MKVPHLLVIAFSNWSTQTSLRSNLMRFAVWENVPSGVCSRYQDRYARAWPTDHLTKMEKNSSVPCYTEYSERDHVEELWTYSLTSAIENYTNEMSHFINIITS